MRARRLLCLFLTVLMLIPCLAGCGGQTTDEKKEFKTFEDFEGAKLGVLTGSEFDSQTSELFPNSEKLQFFDVADLILSLESGKTDGFLLDSTYYSAIAWERQGYKAIVSDKTTPVSFAFMLSESDMAKKIRTELDECIAAMKADGSIDALAAKWLSGVKPTEFEDYSSLSGEKGTIKVACAASDMPLSFVSEGVVTGFDVEIMIAFAKAYGYGIEFSAVDFDAKLGGITSNKYDVAIGGITVTDERREEMAFSATYYESPVYMVTKGVDNGNTFLSSMSGKRIGIVTGTMTSLLVPKLIPDAIYVEFNSVADVKMALDNGKVDAFPTDESVYLAMCWEGSAVQRIDEPLAPSDYGVIFTKGKNPELQNEFNAYLESIKADGSWQSLRDKWFSTSEPTEFATYDDLTGENGTLRVGICSTTKPFTYIKNGTYAGYDVEIIVGFARAYGYKIEFEDAMFSGVLSGVSSGTFDMGAAGFTITDERKESVDFSDVYHTEDLVLVVKQQNSSDKRATRLSDLSGKKLGIMTGTIQAILMPELIPDANYMEFKSLADLIVALNGRKIDAFGCDASFYTSLLWEGQAVSLIDEPLASSDYGMIFPKGKNAELREEVNEYLKKIKADGTLEALEEKWFGATEPTEYASYEDLDGTKGTLSVAITSFSMPFIYLKDNRFVGFDIDLITAFAKEYGYNIKFEDVEFVAILGGIQSGKYDIGISGITITEERKESVDYSDVYHVEDLVVVVRSESGEDDLAQFGAATLGVVTGSLYGGYSREQFPNASIKEFNTFADALFALKQGVVSGIMLDKPNFNSVARTDKSLVSITVPAYSVEIGFGFQKNDGGYALQAQMNEFLGKLEAQGKTEELIDKWYGETEPSESIPLDELSSNAKTLNVAIDTTRKPFVYMYEGKPVGFEIEVLYMFCKEYGYNVKISDLSFASGLAGLTSEKYDMVCGGLYMTDERKQSVNFSEPYMYAEVVMAKCERSGFENFMLSLKSSFEKTFVREQRWKLIVEGIGTTMLISVSAVLGGSLLGFALYMAARSKMKWLSRLAKGVAKVYSTIIAGTPTLVVLMVLFYIVFTSPNMSGVVVAIIGFVLTFGSFVYDHLSLTVSGVDNGQLEAAYALGYSRNQTFFRIVFPQAMKMFLPSYSGEIIGLIKATSVVGYIAVNDLTKMGDIIRGNTYEAFFPLIAVAVIYFAITWGVAALLGILKNKTEPKRRKNQNILKGVVR